MKKIDWNNVETLSVSGGFATLPVDGYVCGIVGVVDHEDDNYLEIKFDVIEGEYKGFYKKQYDADTRSEKFWGGTARQYYTEKSLPFFKAFLTAMETSNKNFKWNEEDEQYFVGKKIGYVMRGKEKVAKNGNVYVQTITDMARSVDAIKSGDFKIQDVVKATGQQATTTTKAPDFSANLDDLFGE